MNFGVLALLFLVSYQAYGQDITVTPVAGGLSGTGTTTRYWDCCKVSCGWVENTEKTTAVQTCEADGVTPTANYSIQSSCIGGTAYSCSNQEAIVINDTFALGFTAVSFTGGSDVNHCCSCFLLTFTSGITGKQLLVQATNTGGDLGSNQFDLAIPGGGVGIFTEGCVTQWGTPTNGWGDQYGGVSSVDQCDQLPTDLQSGCRFRFEWMQGVSNPGVSFQEVECPSQLTDISGCI